MEQGTLQGLENDQRLILQQQKIAEKCAFFTAIEGLAYQGMNIAD